MEGKSDTRFSPAWQRPAGRCAPLLRGLPPLRRPPRGDVRGQGPRGGGVSPFRRGRGGGGPSPPPAAKTRPSWRLSLPMPRLPDSRGHFGPYGGRYVAETLMPALLELERAYGRLKRDRSFRRDLDYYLRQYAGRETPLFFASRLSQRLGGARIYLKR